MAIEASSTPGQPPTASLHTAAQLDRAALAKLFDAYLPRIYGFIARRIDDREAVESVTAATFERVLQTIDGDGVPPPIGTLLYRIAASAVVDHARRRRKAIPRGTRASDRDRPGDREAAEAMADETATRSFAVAIDRSRLRRALLRLTESDRRLILLKYFDGLEVDEVCAALNCSRQAYAVRLHRALRALRSEMEEGAIDAA
jgi:RNA polymerase sigma-70 factor (ECF subfamily)